MADEKYKNPDYHKNYYKKHREKIIQQVMEAAKKPERREQQRKYNKKYRKENKAYFKKWKKDNRKHINEYARNLYLKKKGVKMKTYKVIILDLDKIKFGDNNYFRSTTIKSKYKIENFKRKIERYFGKKGV